MEITGAFWKLLKRKGLGNGEIEGFFVSYTSSIQQAGGLAASPGWCPTIAGPKSEAGQYGGKKCIPYRLMGRTRW